MRLKFLFFPIIIVISVAIFAGFIWPEIVAIKKINEDGIAKKNELEVVLAKKASIELVGTRIAGSAEDEALVKSYLPADKAEERIIAGVNYLAGDANISLVNIALSTPKSSSTLPADAAKVAAVAPVGPGNMIAAPLKNQPLVVNEEPVRVTTAKITLNGDYEKTRIFLDNLQRMPIFNTIKTINIIKKQDQGSEVNKESLTLVTDIAVDFGYLNSVKIGNQHLSQFKPELDDVTIVSLRNYISQKSQFSGDGGAKGKANPFLAN